MVNSEQILNDHEENILLFKTYLKHMIDKYKPGLLILNI